MRRATELVCWPLVVTVVAWGFNFVSLKALFVTMSDSTVALVRWAAMYLLLLAWTWLRRERAFPPRKDAPIILLSGFVSLGIYMVFFMHGLASTTPAEGAIMLATVPVLTTLLAVAFKLERLVPAALFSALVAFSGVAIVEVGSGGAGHGSLYGNALVLCSALLWALGIILSKPLLARYSPLELLTMSMPGALPALLPFGLKSTLETNWSAVGTTGWIHFVQVSLISGVIAFQCFYAGVKQIGASNASYYQFVVPVLTALFGWLVFGSLLSPLQWIGFVIVLASVGALNRVRQVRASQP